MSIFSAAIGNATRKGIVLLCLTGISTAASYSGIVTDKTTGLPLNNVRVSVGYTDAVTRTDKNGRYSLSNGSAVTFGRLFPVSEMMEMHFKNRQAIVTLANAPSIRTIQLFSLSGRCMFRKDISDRRHSVMIPELPHGIYLLRLTSAAHTFSSFRINSLISNHISGKIISGPTQARQTTASLSAAQTLVFQHDSYYPTSLKTVNSTPEVSVTMKPDPRAPVFDESVLHSYYLTMTKDDSLKMERDALLENYVPAGFTFNDSLIGDIGIRYKGSVYSLPNCFDSVGNRADKPVCRKISLKLKFNKYVDGQKFYAMKRLNLHSMSNDDTKLHDILSYGLFREMGIISPRAAFSNVYLNGVFQGVFVAVEAPDGRFAKARWPDDPEGNLYKEKWPVSSREDYYRQGLKTNEENAVVTRMVDFHKALTAADANSFISTVSPFIDFDYFLHYIAVDRVIHNSDGIMTWYTQENWTGNHNYFFYQETNPDGRFWIIPWDMDVTFSKTDPIIDDLAVPDWNVAPEDCEPVKVWGDGYAIPAHCDPLIGMTADLFWDEYVRISERMLANEFTEAHITGKIDRCRSLIDTAIKKDPYVDYDSWITNVAALRKSIGIMNRSFDDYIHKRVVVPDTSGFTDPFDGPGYLESDRLNNFEYVPSPDGYEWTNQMASENTITSVIHDTTSPLWGKADLRFSFVFNTAPGTGMYREWARTSLKFNGSQNLSTLKEVSVALKSDIKRSLWIFLESPVYSKNDIATEYGWWVSVTPRDSVMLFPIADAAYPTWEKGNPPDIINEVLSDITGIGFGPIPPFDNDGELATTPDSGYLRMDNIRFVYQ